MENKIEVGQIYTYKANTKLRVKIVGRNFSEVYYTCIDGVDDLAYSTQYKTFLTTYLLESNDTNKEESPITPTHYNSTKITPFQVIDDWQLDFYLGNVIKYICRKDKKNNALEDLRKAQQYLKVAIDKLENGEVK